MTIEQQIEQLEISMDSAKKIISDMDSLLRLSSNKDFIQIIDEGYFVKEASRLVLSKAMPDMSDDAKQKEIDNAIVAIGYLRKHFSGIVAMGRMAEKSLKDSEVTRDEMMQEAAQ